MSSTATAPATQPVPVSRPPVPLFLSREKRSTILCLLLALVTLAFYNPVVRNGFINFDDNFYITENAHVRAGLTWETVKWAFTSYEAGNWHPVTWLSHALDCKLFGLNPVGHHYVSVLLHVMNALLLFLLLQSATGFTWRSFMVAALFAVHPVNVESVAWAAERKNVLSMLFFLLTLHAYGWYVRRESVRRYGVVAALFAVGLMAKPEIITLPFVLLLWDYWPLRRMGSRRSADEAPVAVVSRSFSFLCLEKAPLLLLSAGNGVITWLAQQSGNSFRGASLRVRVGNALVAYFRYLGKAFWPTRLAALYPHPGRLLPNWEIVVSAALLVLVTALVLYCRDRRYLAMGWFWFLGTLVPVLGLVQVGVQAMADRYAYIPYIGLFVCVVWGVAEIAEARMIPAVWLGAPAIFALTTLGAVSSHQIGYWYDNETFWRHIVNVTEMNYTAHDSLGRILVQQGRTEEAIAEFNAVESLHAYTVADMVRFASFEQAHGHLQEAIEEYTRALDEAPDSRTRTLILSRLGLAFTQMGDISRARKSYASALGENPDDITALIGSGLLAEREGNLAVAVNQISHAMKVEPTDVGYLLLGQALRRGGRLAEAEDARMQAQKISHDFALAESSTAKIVAAAGIKLDWKADE